MGAQNFLNGQAHEYLETAHLTERERREVERLVAADDAKWSGMASEQYGSTTQRLSRDIDQVLRICGTGEETVDSILEDLRNGEIDATEAAKALNAARRDLNKLRKLTQEAEQTEAQVWESVNCSPAQFQQALMHRAPMLFRGGKNYLALPTAD